MNFTINNKDTIVLKDGQFEFANLNELLSKDITSLGVLCSTNIAKPLESLDVVDLKCHETLRSVIHLFDLKPEIYVSCPIDCGNFPEFLVYGTILYRDDSSICRAAIHSGFIYANSSYVVKVIKAKGSSFYEGSTQNKITSLSFYANVSPLELPLYIRDQMEYLSDKFWGTSFMIDGAFEQCPLDNLEKKIINFLPRPSSFIELSSELSVSVLHQATPFPELEIWTDPSGFNPHLVNQNFNQNDQLYNSLNLIEGELDSCFSLLRKPSKIRSD